MPLLFFSNLSPIHCHLDMLEVLVRLSIQAACGQILLKCSSHRSFFLKSATDASGRCDYIRDRVFLASWMAKWLICFPFHKLNQTRRGVIKCAF